MSKVISKKCPQENSWFISKFFFTWTFPILKKGYSKKLAFEDIYSVRKDDEAKELGERIAGEWCEDDLDNKNLWRLPISLFKIFWPELGFYTLLVFIDELVVRVLQLVYFKEFIKSLSESKEPGDIYYYACMLALLTFVDTMFLHTTAFGYMVNGMKIKVALTSLVYRKILRLATLNRIGVNKGKVINLLSTDLNLFHRAARWSGYIIAGPVQVFIFMWLLWNDFGPSSLAGIIFILLFFPIQYLFGRFSNKYRSEAAERGDNRTTLMNQIIVGIKSIKIHGWEKCFTSIITSLRKKEVNSLRKQSRLRALHYLMESPVSSRLLSFITFLSFLQASGGDLVGFKVFFAVSVFNILREVMISILPMAASSIGEIIPTFRRLHEFLLLDEHEEIKNEYYDAKKFENENYLKIENGFACWNNSEEIALQELNFDCTGNKLIMIIGEVGSGKSSFLQVLLGELELTKGKVEVGGSLAFSSQEPWLFTGTIKENILFGLQFNELEYEKILKVVSLKEDLVNLPHGDQTQVGDRGVKLSGGQKYRVSLARTLYRKSGILLLDDPLAALDHSVGETLFHQGIKNQNSLTILVTHNLNFLEFADHIILMEQGNIKLEGTFEELCSREEFTNFIGSNKQLHLNKKETNEIESEKDELLEEEFEFEESSSSGTVTSKTYLDYVKAGNSSWKLLFIILFFIVVQGIFITTDILLMQWTNTEEMFANNETIPEDSTLFYGSQSDRRRNFVTYYSILLALLFIVTSFETTWFFSYSMDIAQNIHAKMFNIIRAPIKFFDNNSSGRIMNRFSSDIGTIGTTLPETIYECLSHMLRIFSLVVIIGISNFYTIIPAVVLLPIMWFIRKFYIKASRNMKRLESLGRSPLFNHFSETLDGLTTIRSLKAHEYMLNKFYSLQNIETSAYYLFMSMSRAFGVWMELLCVVFFTFVVLSFPIFFDKTGGGNIGVAITSAITVTGLFQWGMRQSAEVENMMISTERSLEYSKVESEADLDSKKEFKPDDNWPTDGSITFKNVSISYNGETDALQDLNLHVEGKHKIGIVGRTGAGKSTIVSALLRLVEPKGQIVIDGVEIEKIGLHDLRKRMSVIPQDPFLFQESIRFNLDPFNEYEEFDLWKSIEKVGLKDRLDSLDYSVSEGGKNFSVGERQLICLARALLRNNQIIILDEATASIDQKTDALIQKTIKDEFHEKTVLTIAHRIETILDSNLILILSHGKLKEYGKLKDLKEDPNCEFFNEANAN